jgi:hypothetical protein
MPDSVVIITNNLFYVCNSLINIRLSENITSLPSNTISNSYSTNLTELIIPAKITNIGSNDFSKIEKLTLFGNVVKTLTSDPYITIFPGLKIYVNKSLLASYKTAQYWSKYANYFVSYN